MAVSSFIEGFYNAKCLHSALGSRTRLLSGPLSSPGDSTPMPCKPSIGFTELTMLNLVIPGQSFSPHPQ